MPDERRKSDFRSKKNRKKNPKPLGCESNIFSWVPVKAAE